MESALRYLEPAVNAERFRRRSKPGSYIAKISATPLAAREARCAPDTPGHLRLAVPPFLAQGVALAQTVLRAG